MLKLMSDCKHRTMPEIAAEFPIASAYVEKICRDLVNEGEIMVTDFRGQFRVMRIRLDSDHRSGTNPFEWRTWLNPWINPKTGEIKSMFEGE